jgi:hypothetical protein
MTPTLDSLLQSAAPPPTPFGASSRYYGIETATLTVAGRSIVYLRRRFVPPPPDPTAALPLVKFRDGLDRLDRLARTYLGDAELFWQLCDANGALDPAELEVAGRVLRIPVTLPFAGGAYG